MEGNGLMADAAARARAIEKASSQVREGRLVVRRASNRYDHVWRWRTCQDPYRPLGIRMAHVFAERVGQRCRVLARGRLNSCLIEFEDGLRTVCSRYAVRGERG